MGLFPDLTLARRLERQRVESPSLLREPGIAYIDYTREALEQGFAAHIDTDSDAAMCKRHKCDRSAPIAAFAEFLTTPGHPA